MLLYWLVYGSYYMNYIYLLIFSIVIMDTNWNTMMSCLSHNAHTLHECYYTKSVTSLPMEYFLRFYKLRRHFTHPKQQQLQIQESWLLRDLKSPNKRTTKREKWLSFSPFDDFQRTAPLLANEMSTDLLLYDNGACENMKSQIVHSVISRNWGKCANVAYICCSPSLLALHPG